MSDPTEELRDILVDGIRLVTIEMNDDAYVVIGKLEEKCRARGVDISEISAHESAVANNVKISKNGLQVITLTLAIKIPIEEVPISNQTKPKEKLVSETPDLLGR